MNAIAYFKKAIDLSPEVAQSWWYLGVTQIEAGDNSGVSSLEKAISLGYSLNENEHLRLIGLYAKLSNFEKIASLYESLTKNINPKNAQYHASLAQTYVQLKRINDAVDQAHKAAELDPKFEMEAKIFVQNIGGRW